MSFHPIILYHLLLLLELGDGDSFDLGIGAALHLPILSKEKRPREKPLSNTPREDGEVGALGGSRVPRKEPPLVNSSAPRTDYHITYGCY